MEEISKKCLAVSEEQLKIRLVKLVLDTSGGYSVYGVVELNIMQKVTLNYVHICD